MLYSLIQINEKSPYRVLGKFKMWFRQYTDMEEFEFVSERMDIGDDEYFAAMIIQTTHPDLTTTIDAFHQYFHDLRKKLE